jgi:hypothetical protein
MHDLTFSFAIVDLPPMLSFVEKLCESKVKAGAKTG